jgi:hypothetical protein
MSMPPAGRLIRAAGKDLKQKSFRPSTVRIRDEVEPCYIPKTTGVKHLRFRRWIHKNKQLEGSKTRSPENC